MDTSFYHIILLDNEGKKKINLEVNMQKADLSKISEEELLRELIFREAMECSVKELKAMLILGEVQIRIVRGTLKMIEKAIHIKEVK